MGDLGSHCLHLPIQGQKVKRRLFLGHGRSNHEGARHKMETWEKDDKTLEH